MGRRTSSSSPRSHSDRLCVWAVDISGWAESLDSGTSDGGHGSSSAPSSSLSHSVDKSRGGSGTPVDKIIEELIGSHGHDIVTEDMRRASTKIRKYIRQVDRVRSLAGQLLPRVMYSQTYPDQCTWTNMKFGATKENRPFLAEPKHLSITDYNVTHDEDWIAIAFHAPSADEDGDDQDPRRVGIDVMAVALPNFDPSVAGFVSMMELAMTPAEQKWVMSANPGAKEAPHDYFTDPKGKRPAPQKGEDLNPQEHEMLMRLYDLWTYKEALTKNVGCGLGFDFSTIELAFWRCPEVPLPVSPSSPTKEENDDKLNRAARQHASRTSAGRPGADPSKSILTLAGKPEGRYSFVEIHLPASRAERREGEANGPAGALAPTPTRTCARSQLVVCEGPYPEGTLTSSVADAGDNGEEDGSGHPTNLVQIAPALDAADAMEAGLLRIWTMAELVEEARKLRRDGRFFHR
ncbi:unnamed protein product [Tilletia controversa]|uniref:holo-[acyl-carrier-protein] synthase n=3 Tax=Tilletia TaxID=13289 RepID=A0A8X7T0R8_9BASI|nr:hypothetical protein CF336_g217 [Tilletia laevis]KAE8205860.1 hypothetical protein CF328_g240 [Tilletia controversa]KAE8264156.1 hypothetical protein A4X03_0g1145 [Tilletia caries]KAE8208909.1 hypothetical protein CF335_g52 [Tilletia laevis]KAE8255968.1 hypothetical protein A4X06_0g146 [Tilletia controversa]